MEFRFRAAWDKKQFLYVGSLGHWNNAEKLFDAFTKIASVFDEEVKFIVATTEPIILPTKSVPFSINFTSVPHDTIHDFYNNSLALIIAGSAGDDYFSQANMRINYFSTKAVEALSLGLPILVNDDLIELAEFVETHQCGFKLSQFNQFGRKNENSGLALRSNRQWSLVSKNAEKAGKRFIAENVHLAYLNVWEKLIKDDDMVE